MKISEILAKLTPHKGQNITLAWRRAAKVRKLNPPPFLIEKQTVARVRTGIDHENRAPVLEKRADGIEAQGLKGFRWLEFPFILASESTGKPYVRAYPQTGTESRPRVQWFADGVPVGLEDVRPYLLASETSERESDGCECWNLSADSLVAIGEKIENANSYL